MEIHFSRELDGSYLVVRETAPGDHYTAKMLEESRPPQLMPLRLRENEGAYEYSYEIGGLRSLESLLATREISGEEIRSLMRSIYQISNDLEEYLLNSDRLWLEPGLIHHGKNGWVFCLHPPREQDFFLQLQALSRFLLKKANHEDEQTATMAYELFRVCHEDNFCFAQIFEALEEKLPETVAEEAAEKPAEELRERAGFRRFFRRK